MAPCCLAIEKYRVKLGQQHSGSDMTLTFALWIHVEESWAYFWKIFLPGIEQLGWSEGNWMDFCEPREASITPYRSAEKEALAEDSSEPQAFAVVCLSPWEDAKLKIHTKEFTKTKV